MKEFLEDKPLAIVAVTLIALVAMFRLPEPLTIVLPCVTGIAAFVTGVKIGKERKL